jgi:hypothetical protein
MKKNEKKRKKRKQSLKWKVLKKQVLKKKYYPYEPFEIGKKQYCI